MATQISAGVYVKEFDFSSYAPALALTTLCIIGGATRGPLNVPTDIPDEPTLISTFGPPVLDDWGLQAAVQFLKQGSQLIYLRVAHSDAAIASYPVSGLTGGTPAVKATGSISFAGSANPADGDKVTLRASIPIAKVQNNNVGTIGNQAITCSATPSQATGLSGGDVSHFATGTISFLNGVQPASGDTITISDGVTTKIFQFVAATGGHIQVALGTDAYGTLANLITAINGAGFNIAAVNATVSVTFEFDNNGIYNPANVPVAINGSSSAYTLSNFITAIANNPQLGISPVANSVSVPNVNLTNNGTPGLAGNAPITATGSVLTPVGLHNGVNAIPGSSTTVAGVYANTPGTWGNNVQVVVQATQVMGAPLGNFDLLVYYPQDASGTLALVEQFSNLSMTATSSRFADTALAQGISGEFGPSQYVTWDTLILGSLAVGQTIALGVNPGTVGADGITNLDTADYIGAVYGQNATGMAALTNQETTEYNVLAIPGVVDKDVINAAIALVEGRGDAIFLVDTPFGLSVSEVIDWHNGASLIVPNAPTAPLTSSYAAIYWSWVKVYDEYNKTEVFLPPSGFVGAVYAYNDNQAGPWAVPAGLTRGKVIGDLVEYSPSQAERAQLNAGQNRINPIVNFFNSGLVVYGQRTCQRIATALDSVATRRMLIYAEKLCATAAAILVFEPNDPLTWKRFTGLVNPILANIQSNQGLASFQVVCDASTNPSIQISNKKMRAKLLVEAQDAAEIIELDFALFANGATLVASF